VPPGECTSRKNHPGRHHQHQRQFEYTLDMYAFAAYQLYLDFINFFLYMLRLLGERRD